MCNKLQEYSYFEGNFSDDELSKFFPKINLGFFVNYFKTDHDSIYF